MAYIEIRKTLGQSLIDYSHWIKHSMPVYWTQSWLDMFDNLWKHVWERWIELKPKLSCTTDHLEVIPLLWSGRQCWSKDLIHRRSQRLSPFTTLQSVMMNQKKPLHSCEKVPLEYTNWVWNWLIKPYLFKNEGRLCLFNLFNLLNLWLFFFCSNVMSRDKGSLIKSTSQHITGLQGYVDWFACSEWINEGTSLVSSSIETT